LLTSWPSSAAGGGDRLFRLSALVKLVLDEAGSDVAAQLWNACDAAVSSRPAYPEVCEPIAA
jgi:hypothetical protein